MVCVDAVDTKQIVVEAGMSWWLILVHAQSVSGVGNVWVPESGGVVQVVFTELGGAACAPAAGVSIRVTRSWGGYIWSRYHSVAWGEEGLEWMHVLWVGGVVVHGCVVRVWARGWLACSSVVRGGIGSSLLAPGR